jgi:hypothetical protein
MTRFYASAITNSGGDGGLLFISLLGLEIAKLGHDVKLIPAQHVTPFVRMTTTMPLRLQRPANVRISALCRLKLSTNKKCPVCNAFVSDSVKTKPR